MRADVRRADDEAELFELDQRLADGGLADVQVVREVQFAQRVAGFQPAGEDGVAQRLEDARAERTRLQRFEQGSGLAHRKRASR